MVAGIAAATHVAWVSGTDSGWIPGTSLVCTLAAVPLSLWALLVAPTRPLTAAAYLSLACALTTAVLWCLAIVGILETT